MTDTNRNILQHNNIHPPANTKIKHQVFKDNNISFIKLAMLNVRTLSIEKQQSIIDLMKDEQIHILGVSETSLSEKQSKFIYRQEKNWIVTHHSSLTTPQVEVAVRVL